MPPPQAIQCKIEIAGLPVLENCPADNEYIMFVGAQGGFGHFGYALRSWALVKSCLNLTGLRPDMKQVTVPQDFGNAYRITPPDNYEFLENSMWVSYGGTVLAQGVLDDQVGYDVTYNYEASKDAFVEFYNAGEPLAAGQILIFHYILKIENQ